jgi:CHASE3 domain sensor protein
MEDDFVSLRTQQAGQSQSERSMESQLESSAKAKQVEMDRTIDLRQRGYRHRSFVLVNTNEGKGYMDEARGAVASLSSEEDIKFARIDSEKTLAFKKILSVTIIANSVLLVLAAGLFVLMRYHGKNTQCTVSYSVA